MSKPDSGSLALFEVLREVSILSQLAGALLEARTPKGVLASHFGVLNHLLRVRDGATPLEIARAFQVPKTTMTHTLAGLAERGWIAFRPNPQDARSKQVWLTGAGRRFVTDMVQVLADDTQDVQAALPGLAERLRPDLQRLRAYLDARRDGDAG